MTRIVLIFLLLSIKVFCFSQVAVTGKVLNEDNESLIGVTIIEKGTENRTISGDDGSFSLTVESLEAILKVRFAGYLTQWLELNGQDSVVVNLKLDCIDCFADAQTVTYYTRTGLKHLPFGGQIDAAFPTFKKATLIGGIAYQTDFENNKWLDTKIIYRNTKCSCKFNIDVNGYFRKASLKNKFDLTRYAMEGNFSYRNYMLVLGYSYLEFHRASYTARLHYNAPLFGLGIKIRPLKLQLIGKGVLYDGKTEFLGEANFNMKTFDVFMNYYQLDSFSEVTIGIKKTIPYSLKSNDIQD